MDFPTAPRKALLFAPDTWIDIPARTWANNVGYTVEYVARRDNNAISLFPFGTTDNIAWDEARAGTAGHRFSRGGTARALAALAWDTGVAQKCTGVVDPPGTITGTLDPPNESRSGSVGTNSSTAAWYIGKREGSVGWEGYIADFKIYDENGTLIHFWAIDDNVADGGTIVDSVGGLNGTLTLGAGSWIDIGSTSTIAITSQPAPFVARNSATLDAQVTISGTYAGANQIEVSTDGGQNWVLFDPAPTTTFSGTLTVPQGGPHAPILRDTVDNTQTATATDFYIGKIYGLIGQSNAYRWNRYATATVLPAGSHVWDKQDTDYWNPIFSGASFSGYDGFIEALSASESVPVAIINYAVGSTRLSPPTGDTWSSLDPGSLLSDFIDVVPSAGGSIEGVMFIQGEFDYSVNTSYADYKSALGIMVGHLRTNIVYSGVATELPIVVGVLGRDGTDRPEDADSIARERIQTAQIDYANETQGVYAVPMIGPGMVDLYHYDSPGYYTIAQRCAVPILAVDGFLATGASPRVVSASEGAAGTVTVTIAHGLGTDFTPTSNIGEFELSDDDFATVLSIVSAVRVSPTTLELTYTGTPAGPLKLRYAWGHVVDTVTMVYDNASAQGAPVNLPLMHAFDVPVSVSPTLSLDAITQAHALAGVAISLPTGVRKVLDFAWNTWVALPEFTFPCDLGYTVEYSVLQQIDGVARSPWGTLGVDTESDSNTTSGFFRVRRGGANETVPEVLVAAGVEYTYRVKINPPGTVTVTQTPGGATGSQAAGLVPTTAAWHIGSRTGQFTWNGLIWDFKIYDHTGALIHHWPIDDNVSDGGEITDIVGGMHGTLELGSGSWVDRAVGYSLNPESLSQSHTVGSSTLGVAGELTVADLSQATLLGGSALTQAHILSLGNMEQLHGLDAGRFDGFLVGELNATVVTYTVLKGTIK